MDVAAPPRSVAGKVYNNLAAQDWLITAYLAAFVLAVVTGEGTGKDVALTRLFTDAALYAAGLVLVRGELVRGVFASALYRVTVFLPVFLSYFQLREIFPAVTSRSIDLDIYAFDLKWLHYEPSVAWDKYVTPATTEWFAFFYFGYFFLIAAHIFPFMLGSGNTRLLRHFSFGVFLQFCVSHTGYLIVPGWGPYKTLQFDHELAGGLFWGLVVATVKAGSAMKDIFPSLHTGAPTFMTLFSFIHRKELPFKYTWVPMAFCVTQIVIATMFLRWHWFIDILAGASLACVSAFGGHAIVLWEERRREARGAHGVFGDAPVPWLLAKLRRG
jgi:hypothetical protein